MSERCTVWLKTRREDWPKAARILKDDDGYESDDLTDDSPFSVEYSFNDVKYVDDLLQCLRQAGIPFRSVNSDGEIPESIWICLPGEERVGLLADGDLVVKANLETGEFYPDSYENAKELVKLNKKFDDYCKTGVM